MLYHLVYDSQGNVVHGTHEEPASRDSNYVLEFPFNLKDILYPQEEK